MALPALLSVAVADRVVPPAWAAGVLPDLEAVARQVEAAAARLVQAEQAAPEWGAAVPPAWAKVALLAYLD